MSATLLVNDVFERDKCKYRLVHVNQKLDAAYVVPIEGDAPDPRRWPISALTAMVPVPHWSDADQRPQPPSKQDVAVRDLRWSRIKDIVNSPDILAPRTRGPLLKKHAATIGVSDKTLRANLRQWWVGGQTPDALLGTYFRSGRIEVTTPGALAITEKSPNGTFTYVFAPAKTNARGRRPKDGGYKPLAMSADVRRIVLDVARKFYENDASKSVRGATTVVLNKLFSLYDENGVALRDKDDKAVLKNPGHRPSFDQIRYLLSKAMVISITHKRRNGAADYENNHAPATGSVLDDCLGPGDVYEIDATIIDVYIVAKANRRVIIGKPTLFLIIDRWSRLIVGFYITLENPSWNEATQAILSISGDWEAVCKRLGVTYSASDWPAVGAMPNRFFGDRADMITYASDALCDGVAVQVTNAPALMSSCKPIAESGFLTTHVPLKESAPGYEPPTNPFKRRAKKFHKDASMTLDEIAATYLRIVIAHNRMEKSGYQASAEEIMQNLPCTPKAIWTRGIAERMGSIARMPVDLLRRKLMPRDTATVKVDGIHFRDCIYKSAELGEWCTRASLRGSFQVPVAYTPNLVDKIIAYDPTDSRKEYVLTLTTTSDEFSGYTFAEVMFVHQTRKTKDRNAVHINEAHSVARMQDIEAITAPATAAMKAATKGITPGVRLSGGDEVRAVEAQQRRQSVQDIEHPGLHYGTRGADSDKFSGASPVGPVPASTPTAAAQLPSPTTADAAPKGAPCPASPPSSCGDTDPDIQAALNRLLD
jgi:putative transposase